MSNRHIFVTTEPARKIHTPVKKINICESLIAQPVTDASKSWQFLHHRVRALQGVALQLIAQLFDQGGDRLHRNSLENSPRSRARTIASLRLCTSIFEYTAAT